MAAASLLYVRLLGDELSMAATSLLYGSMATASLLCGL
jgi:hypothetical protein